MTDDAGRRRTGRALAIVCVVVLSTAARCPWSGSTPEPLIGELQGALGQARGLGELPGLTGQQASVRVPLRSLDDLLGRAPREPSQELTQVLSRAEQARAALGEVQAVQQQADSALAQLPASADEVAAESTEVRQYREVIADTVEDLATEVACELGFDGLAPGEQDEVKRDLAGNEVVLTYAGRAGAATLEAVTSAGQEALAERVSPEAGRFVRWSNFGSGVFQKAQGLMPGSSGQLGEPIVAPDWSHTRALYYWARVCLKLPS